MSKPETPGPPPASPAAPPAPPAALPREVARTVRDTCLCLRAQQAARALARRFDAELRPLGINNGQFSLMMMLNRPEPRPLGALARALAMDRTTLTAKIKPLARRGLVTVGVDAADRRGRLLTLTEAGRALLAEAHPLWQRAHAAIEREAGGGAGGFDAGRVRTDLEALARIGA